MRAPRRPGRSVTAEARRRSRLRAPEERRLRLLEAACELLRERSPGSVSVEAITDRAGVAKGTFYLYFSSRDQLLESVRERWIEERLAASGGLEHGDWPTQIRVLVELMADLVLGEPRLHTALLHHPPRSDPPVAALGTLEDRVERSIREAQATGAPDPPEPWSTAAFLVHGIHGVLDRYLRARPGMTERARVVEETARLAERLLEAAGCGPPGHDGQV